MGCWQRKTKSLPWGAGLFSRCESGDSYVSSLQCLERKAKPFPFTSVVLGSEMIPHAKQRHSVSMSIAIVRRKLTLFLQDLLNFGSCEKSTAVCRRDYDDDIYKSVWSRGVTAVGWMQRVAGIHVVRYRQF